MTNLQDKIYEGANIGLVLRLLRADLLERPISLRAPFSTGELLQRHAEIEQDYQRMVDFLSRGFDDADRDALCMQLYQRLFALAGDLYLCRLAESNASYIKASAASKLLPSDIDQLKGLLESFPLDVTTASLSGKDTQTEKLKSIYKTHTQMADNFFGWLLSSPGWNDSMAQSVGDMLLSPTIDSNDALLAVSAVTMSLLTIFDENKWLMLVRLWREATLPTLSQRAFVGWVITLPRTAEGKTGRSGLFHRMTAELERILDSDSARSQFLDLQMQIFQCLSAESDGKKMQEEIMPELIKNSDVKLENGKIVEREEDPMEDILPHNDATDRAKKMEESIQKLNNLHNSGADIYFHGFRQMKHFPFFSVLSNWFLPFYIEHPEVQSVSGTSRRFVEIMANQQQFCDSDKYSIALVFRQMNSRLGAMDKEYIVTSDGFTARTEFADEAMARRHYVQDLYRFFSVSSYRSDFPNPFSDMQRMYFFASKSFPVESFAVEAEQLALYFYKRKRDKEIIALYQRLGSYATPLVSQLAAVSLQHVGKYKEAYSLSTRLLQDSPDMPLLLGCQAVSAKALARWNEAAQSYSRLLKVSKYSASAAQSLSLCLIRSGRPTEALPYLQRINYENPNNLHALNLLVEAYLSLSNFDDAYQLTRSLSLPKMSDDVLPSVLECCQHLCVRSMYVLVARRQMKEAISLLHDGFVEYFKSDVDSLQRMILADRILIEQMELSMYSIDLVVSVATS